MGHSLAYGTKRHASSSSIMFANKPMGRIVAEKDAGKKPRIRVAEAVESGVEGFLLFLVRFARTGLVILTSPRKALRRMLADRHASKPSYVLPLTYLAIGLFLLSLLGQTAGTNLFDWIWFADDIAEKVTDALMKEVSLIKVAVQALPGIVIVSAVMEVLRLTLCRHGKFFRRLVPLVLCYAFGAQAMALFAMAFGLIVISTLAGDWQAPGGETGDTVLAFVIYGAMVLSLLTALLSPLIYALNAFQVRRLWRKSRLIATTVVLMLATSLTLGHSAILWATSLPKKIIDTAKDPTSPELLLRDGTFEVLKDHARIRLRFMISNRSDKPLPWETDNLRISLHNKAINASDNNCKNDGFTLTTTQVMDGGGTKQSFVSIEPATTAWFETILTAPRNEILEKQLQEQASWGIKAEVRFISGTFEKTCSYRNLKPTQQ